ncbi:hypothetical protein P0Y35_11895 [Kiritimatiellaeota bacterium B1221]|nr:hypothetical protein [Kiritimatiellaeota bacterium B1221]
MVALYELNFRPVKGLCKYLRLLEEILFRVFQVKIHLEHSDKEATAYDD